MASVYAETAFSKVRMQAFVNDVGLLVKNKDGIYGSKGGSTCYESYLNLRQTCTDRVMITALCKALVVCGTPLGFASFPVYPRRPYFPYDRRKGKAALYQYGQGDFQELHI